MKVSFPDNHEFPLELEALNFYNGIGSIRVLQEDIENGAMLLEKAEPGTRVRDIFPDEKQISFASEVMKKMHKPAPENIASLFPTISDWGKGFDRMRAKYNGTSGPFPKDLFDKAEQIYKIYAPDPSKQVLMHGDLHNDNILLSQRGWIAIDPKGVVGEPEFEPAAFLRNLGYDFQGRDNPQETVKRRILRISEELGYDKLKVQDWAMASAMLSALWFMEDQNKFSDLYVQNAKLLNELDI